jgi:hypothetical protein
MLRQHGSFTRSRLATSGLLSLEPAAVWMLLVVPGCGVALRAPVRRVLTERGLLRGTLTVVTTGVVTPVGRRASSTLVRGV